MADTIESIELEVKHKSSGAFSELDKLAKSISAMNKEITAALPNLEKYAAALGKINAKGGTKAGAKASASVTPVSKEMQELISSASQMDVLEAKLASLRTALEQAFNAGDTAGAYKIQGQILQTQRAMDKLSASARKAAEGVRKIKDESKKASGPLATLLSSIKRIAFYRAIRAAIKAVTDAIREGTENAYQYSKATGGDIAAAYDRIASATFKMKNQMGAAWASLVTALEPIIVRIIQLLTVVIEKVTQFFAALAGKSTYLKAIDYTKEWAEETNKGAGAAKEWKNQLMSFDEINRLEEPSSGGGGANNLPNYELMFVDAPLEDWAMKIKEFIEKVTGWLNNDGPFANFRNQLQAVADKMADLVGASDTVRNAVKKLFPKPATEGVVGAEEEVEQKLAQGAVAAEAAETRIKDAFERTDEKTADSMQGVKKSLTDMQLDLLLKAAGIPILISTSMLKINISLSAGFVKLNSTTRSKMAEMNGIVNTYASQIETRLSTMLSTLSSSASTTMSIMEQTSNTSMSYWEQRNWNMEHGVTYEPDTGFNAAGATGILGGLATIAEVFSAIPMFGSGGYPGAGLFMAGEAGPEMLGTIGGRTAVAGGSEITGISSAVYAVGEAVIATLKSQNLDISLDGRRLAEGLYPYNKAVSTRHGTGLISG